MNPEERIKQRIEQIAVDKSASPSDWRWIEGYMIEGYKIAMEEYRSNLWTSPCICPTDEKTGETLCCNLCGKPTARTSKELPGDEDGNLKLIFKDDYLTIKRIRYDKPSQYNDIIGGVDRTIAFYSPLLASKDARIRELEEANKLAEIKIAELIELNLTPTKN